MMKYILEVRVVFIVQYLLFITSLLGQNPTSSTAPADEEENFSTTTTAGKNKFQNALQQAIQSIKEILQKNLGVGVKKEEKKKEEDPNAKKGVDNKKAKRNLVKKLKRPPHIVGGRGALPAVPANPLVARPKPVSSQTNGQGGNNESPVTPSATPTATQTTSSPFGTGGSGRGGYGNFNPPDMISKLREALGKRPSTTSAADKEEEKLKKEEERRKLLLEIYKNAQRRANAMLALCKEKFGGEAPQCDNANSTGCQKIVKEPFCRELCFRCISLSDAIDKLSGKSSATTPDQPLEELAMPENEFVQILHLIEAIENKFADVTGDIGEAIALFNKFIDIYNGLEATTCSDAIKIEFWGIRDAQTILNHLIQLRQQVVEAAKKAKIYKPKEGNNKEKIEYFYGGKMEEREIPEINIKYYESLSSGQNSNCFKELVTGMRGGGGGADGKLCTKEYESLIRTQEISNYEEFVKMYKLFSVLCITKNEGGKKIGDPRDPVPAVGESYANSLQDMLNKIVVQKDALGEYLNERAADIGLPLLIYTYIAKKTNPALYATLASLHDGFVKVCKDVLFSRSEGKLTIGEKLNSILFRVGIGAKEGHIAQWNFETGKTITLQQQKSMITDVIEGSALDGSYFKTILQNVSDPSLSIENRIESEFVNFQKQFCSAMKSQIIERLIEGDKNTKEWSWGSVNYIKPKLNECVADAKDENAQPPDSKPHCCNQVVKPILSKRLDSSSFLQFKEDTGYITVTEKWERYFYEVQSFYSLLIRDLKDYIANSASLRNDCQTVHEGKECDSGLQSKYDLCAQFLYAMVAKDADFAKYIGKIEYSEREKVDKPIPLEEHYIRIIQEYTKSLAKLKKILDLGQSANPIGVEGFNSNDPSSEPVPIINSWDMVKKALGIGYVARDIGATYAKALSCKALLGVEIKQQKVGDDTYYLVKTNPFGTAQWNEILWTIDATDNKMVKLYNNFFKNYYTESYLTNTDTDHLNILKNIFKELGNWEIKAEDKSKSTCGNGADQTKCYLCITKNDQTTAEEWDIIKYLFLRDVFGSPPDSAKNTLCKDITGVEGVNGENISKLQGGNDFTSHIEKELKEALIGGHDRINFGSLDLTGGLPFDSTSFRYLAKMFFPQLNDIGGKEGKIDGLKNEDSYTLRKYLSTVYGVQDTTPISTVWSSILQKIDPIVDSGSSKTYLLCGKKKSNNIWTPLKCKQNVYRKSGEQQIRLINHPLPASGEEIKPSDIDATFPTISLERFFNALSLLLGGVPQYKEGDVTNIFWYKKGADGKIAYNDNDSLYKSLYKACVGE